MEPTQAQARALAHFRRHAEERREAAQAALADILRMSNVSPARFAQLGERIRTRARVALHFHPDRPTPEGGTVAGMLLSSGEYRSQFETGLSNGSVSAVPGGARDRWEERLFGGAYHAPRVPDRERPRYGALDLLGHGDGPSPRFGSCFFVLAPAVTARCTFTYRDSHTEPRERGTLDALDDVLAALLSDAFSGEQALGERVRPPALLERIAGHLDAPSGRRDAARNLDHYIEGQVHGGVSLAGDVDCLVIDPAFRGTETGVLLERIGATYAMELAWHPGSRLEVARVPDDFRGAAMPSLARRVAPGGVLDARLIGEAAVALARDPAAWSDRGSYPEVLQELKLLWHVLVRYGRDALTTPCTGA